MKYETFVNLLSRNSMKNNLALTDTMRSSGVVVYNVDLQYTNLPKLNKAMPKIINIKKI